MVLPGSYGRGRLKGSGARGTRLAAAGWLLACLSGCTLYPERGPINDFFIKDYDLPEYRPSQAEFHRQRRWGQPEPATGALGGMAGALAGGRLKAWKASAGGALGGLGGALVGEAYVETEVREPLPPTYEVLVLALPIIATDPNKGPKFGILPPLVFKEGKRITNILAPDLITYNKVEGVGAKFRMRRLFSADSNLAVDAGTSSEGADDYEVIYNQRRVGPNQFLYYQAHFSYSTALAERFYGVGNDTEDEDESAYVFRRTLGEAVIGLELPLDLSVEFKERITSYKVGPGRLEDVRSTRAAFPDVSGIREGRLTVLTHQIRLTYDTRDSRKAPSRGLYGEFIYEIADSTLGSDVAFQRFALSITVLIPKFNNRFTTAIHAAGWILTGSKIPFYELTMIGGKATNRGYPRGRFVDQNGWVLNLEERINLFEYEMMGVRQILQLAGFIDVGRVLEEGEGLEIRQSKVSGGAAVRLIVPDSELIVSIDVGMSSEGSAVFVGLDYPW